jgi:hypothetical protein
VRRKEAQRLQREAEAAAGAAAQPQTPQ